MRLFLFSHHLGVSIPIGGGSSAPAREDDTSGAHALFLTVLLFLGGAGWYHFHHPWPMIVALLIMPVSYVAGALIAPGAVDGDGFAGAFLSWTILAIGLSVGYSSWAPLSIGFVAFIVAACAVMYRAADVEEKRREKDFQIRAAQGLIDPTDAARGNY